MLFKNFYYNSECCSCCKNTSFKYTSVDDINNLINEFAEELGDNSRQTHMYMEIYEYYYDQFKDNIMEIYVEEYNWDKTYEKFNSEENFEDLTNDMENLEDLRDIFIPSISSEVYILSKRTSDYITDNFYESFYESICELERDLTLEVYQDLIKFFSNKITSGNIEEPEVSEESEEPEESHIKID